MFKHQLSRDTWTIMLCFGAAFAGLTGGALALKAGAVWIATGATVGPFLMAAVLHIVCDELRWPRSWKEQIQDIKERACEVVTQLQPQSGLTASETVYEDEFLLISCPNDKGEVRVPLKLNGQETPVFARHLVTRKLIYYRRGMWEKHLKELAKNADRVRRRKLIDEEVKLIDEEAKRMGVIDDAGVFSR